MFGPAGSEGATGSHSSNAVEGVPLAEVDALMMALRTDQDRAIIEAWADVATRNARPEFSTDRVCVVLRSACRGRPFSLRRLG